MADFEKAIVHVLKWEGGYVNHPSDPGGHTNRGITMGVFRKHSQRLLGMSPTIENLKTLTKGQAKTIYRKVFWDKIKGDEIRSQDLANALFDAHVNMGGNGIKLMQRLLNVATDGSVGPKTLEAINKWKYLSEELSLWLSYHDAREWYYFTLTLIKPKMKVFLDGWINRLNDLQFTKTK